MVHSDFYYKCFRYFSMNVFKYLKTMKRYRNHLYHNEDPNIDMDLSKSDIIESENDNDSQL